MSPAFLVLLFSLGIVLGYPTNIPQETITIVTGRIGFSTIVVGDYVYVLGGFSNGIPSGEVDVFDLRGEFLGSMNETMPTPRGFMEVVLFNRTTLLTIGGSLDTNGTEALAWVETLNISTDNPYEGEWSSWEDMLFPRCNATAVIYQGGVLVALGINDTAYSTIVEWIDVSTRSSTIYPSLPESGGQCRGVLAALDSNSAILLCSNISFVFTETQWESTVEYPLSPWTTTTIEPLDSNKSLFRVENFAQASLLFAIENGSISLHLCVVIVQCSGRLIFSPDYWICVSDGSFSNSFQISSFSNPQWPGLAGDAQSTRRARGITNCYPFFDFTTYSLKWTYEPNYSPDVLFFPAINGNNTIVAIGSQINADTYDTVQYFVVSISGASGTLNWNTTNQCSLPYAYHKFSSDWTQPTIDSDGCIFFGVCMSLIALDGQTGDMKWSFPVDSMILGSPTIGEMGIYVGTEKGVVYAISRSGELIWKTRATTYIGSSATVGQNETLFLQEGIALDGYTGDAKWNISSTFSEGIVAPSLSLDGTVVYFSSEMLIEARNSQTGALIWQQPQRFNTFHIVPLAVEWGKIFTGPGALIALDELTGDVLWHYNYSIWENDVSPALGIDGTLFSAMNSYIVAYDGESGKTKWSDQVHCFWEICFEYSPSLSSDGTVVIPVQGGALYAWGAELNSHWKTISFKE